MAKSESQYDKAKRRMRSKSRSIDHVKDELRKEFKTRLRDMRSKSVDSGRNITDCDIQLGYEEVMMSLESDMHRFSFVEPEHVYETLQEIQEEFLQEITNQELCSYENFLKEEVDAIVENLVTCKVCEKFSEKDICDSCAVKHFSTF